MPDLGEGVVFAGHRIEGVAGRGGMGTVYRATHIALDHMVALKVIAADLADDGSFRERFRSESRIAVSLRHPNVVPIHNAGEEDGLLFVTMDLIDGPDLRKLLTSRGPLEPAQAVAILEQVAAALDVAHSRDLVHRDIKPGNVLIEDRGGTDHAYLTDFGLTKRIGQPSEATALTSTGAFVGTLDYVAPEQIRGEHLDARTDVYALGCVLYESLVSHPPFAGREEKVAKMYAHLQAEPEALAGSAVVLAEVVERAMAKERDDRFPSAGDMARAARAALEGGEVAPERSVATGPAAPTEVYETPREMPSPTGSGAEALEPTAESQAPVEPTVESEAPVEPTVESEAPIEPAVTAIESNATAEVSPAAPPPTPPGSRGQATEVVEPGDRTRPARSRKAPPLGLIGGGLAAAIVVVLAIVVLGGGADEGGAGEGPTSKTEPIGEVQEAVFVPDTPVGIAVGDGDVRVATRADGELVSVKTEEVFGLELSRADEVVFAAGSWWVTGSVDGRVAQLGAGGDIVDTVPVPGAPTGITAEGDAAIWVTENSSNTLTRIDPASGEPDSFRLDDADGPQGVAVGSGAIWVTSRNNNKLIRVGAQDREQTPIDVGNNPKGVIVAAGAVWVANAGNNENGSDGSVTRVDAQSLEPQEIEDLSGQMRDLAEAPNGTIWASDGQGSVAAIDPESGTLIDTLKIPGSTPEDLAFDRNMLWVTGGEENVVTPVMPNDLDG